MHHVGFHGVQLAGSQAQEMPAVKQPGEFVGCHQAFELAHHSAQGVLMRLQGEPPLTHTLARHLDVTGVKHQPHEHHKQHAHLQQRQRRVG
ncbi:hypothetical protein D3C80_2070750 [compost metagenome]